jgi:3D (Asp-Asp-Asp) domain-containing protein
VLISRSVWRKVFATLVVVTAFVFLYETRILDSRFGLRLGPAAEVGPIAAPGSHLSFSATAYCKGRTTASGVNVRSGIAAADPALLPVGSVIKVDAPGSRNDGVYTIMDTGPEVHGRHLDLYMWSCNEALAFGRVGIEVDVLRLGWNPRASSPSIIDRLFRRREATAPLNVPDAPVPPATLPDSAEPRETPAPLHPTPAPPKDAPSTSGDGPAA